MTPLVHIDVPRDVLESARLTPDEARVELAVHLYAAGRLGFSKARQLAGMPLWQFRHVLGARGVEAQYDAAALAEDLSSLSSSPTK